MTSGVEANAAATVSQPLVKAEGGQLLFHHSPFPSDSEQHHPRNSRWQLGMTMSPAPVRACTQAWYTCQGVRPRRSGFAETRAGGTGAAAVTVDRAKVSRTELKPHPASCAAISPRGR